MNLLDVLKKRILRRKRSFLSPADEKRVIEAIQNAEKGNRGEVRVHIESTCGGIDALERASLLFYQVGMDKTAEDTGVLLYVAVDDCVAAVFAGKGIHSSADPEFWKDVVDLVASGYSRGNNVTGLVNAVNKIGQLLREKVPGEDIHGNELADEIST